MKYHNFVEFLSYDSIALIPVRVSTLEHRAEADTSVQFGPIKLKVPIIAAPMPDVSNGQMAQTLWRLGSLGWIHRFQDSKEQLMQTIFLSGGGIDHTGAGIALPLKWDDKLISGLYESGFHIFCIDTANGASYMVERTIKTLKDKYPKAFLVAGNVATPETFAELQEWGADAIRVGIAGGSVCETKTETGVYSPMATTVYACNLAKTKSLLIADGGIRTPADMCKALALGADVVMVGGVLAGTSESPGEVLKIDGKLYKVLRGAASYSVQRGNSEYNEGAETIVPYQGSVEKVINRFAAGLRSSMSYMDARTLAEYRDNVRIIRVA